MRWSDSVLTQRCHSQPQSVTSHLTSCLSCKKPNVRIHSATICPVSHVCVRSPYCIISKNKRNSVCALTPAFLLVSQLPIFLGRSPHCRHRKLLVNPPLHHLSVVSPCDSDPPWFGSASEQSQKSTTAFSYAIVLFASAKREVCVCS